MWSLLWKDWRLFRRMMILGGILSMLPFGAVYINKSIARNWMAAGVHGSYWSILCCGLVLSTLGGSAIAHEQLDGSDDFLRYLPPSRYECAISKLVVIGLFWSVIIATSVGIFLISRSFMEGQQDARLLRSAVATNMLQLGIAWLFSSFSRNPSASSIAGAFSPMIVWLICHSLITAGFLSDFKAEGTYAIASSCAGAFAIITGTIIYARAA